MAISVTARTYVTNRKVEPALHRYGSSGLWKQNFRGRRPLEKATFEVSHLSQEKNAAVVTTREEEESMEVMGPQAIVVKAKKILA